MKREPLIRRKTAISYKTEKKTVMRGYDLSELAEAGYSFCDALFVLYQNILTLCSSFCVAGLKI